MSLFSTRLQQLRKKKGENQETVAKFLGVQRATYSSYERGVIVPPYSKIKKLSERYDVSVDYIMGETNFENYDIESRDIPDIAQQLTIIADELMSNTSIVECNGMRLTDEEKKDFLPFINGCMRLIEIETRYKNKE